VQLDCLPSLRQQCYVFLRQNSFQNGGAKHGCDGVHGVGWLFLCVCVGLLVCRGTWFSAAYAHFNLKITMIVSPQRTTCIYLGARSRLSLVSASFRNSFKTESSVHNSALLRFRYSTLQPKLCHEYLSNPLEINFLATGTLAANDFHSALPTPVRLLIYSSCFSWSRWCVCLYPINVSYLMHCCLNLSLELLIKGGCAQCYGAWILRS